MLSQRLLDIIRIFNNPSNFDLVQNFELIPQDIEFLRKNGLKVEVVENNSVVSLCKISRDIFVEEKDEANITRSKIL